MSLNNEWGSRIILWMDELRNHFYQELGVVEFSGFTTKKHICAAEALNGSFVPMPTGTLWGAKWEYGWFRGRIELPEEARGRHVVFRPEAGGESAVYINGFLAGARDRQHYEITLSRSGIPGDAYEILVESYAGHGPRVENVSPNPPGRLTIPEPGPAQVVVGRSTFGIWEEDAYQLWMDVDTLYQVRCNTNENSLRVAEIDKALKDFTLIADFELPYEERIRTFQECRSRLKPLLLCVNGSTAPTMYIFGQSHLDLAWLWPLAETERKCARTLSTQLALMDEYPDYKFLFCEPPLHLMLKEWYPEFYERVRERVKSGQIIAEGGIWVESDTNLPSGESLIRQLMYGKKFFRDEYDVDSELLWLPDVFGFSAVLPQLMKGCGIKYFCTKKIIDNYNGGDPFPYNIFLWEGMDGSQVLAHMIRKSNSPIDPKTLIKRWEFDRRQKDGISTFLFPFGYGDGGGGATRGHLEYVRRMKDLEGVPRTKMCHPNEFFKDIEKKELPENRYVGELYFQAHRGTYTSQARTKKGNRKCEFALREAELWGAAAKNINRFPYPSDEMEKAWKTVLFNQFHDVITGVSIQRVHEEAEADYSKVMEMAETVRNHSVSGLIEHGEEVAVFNSLSWNRKELVALPEGFKAAACPSGNIYPVQGMNGQVFAEVNIPSCGWTTLKPVEGAIEIPNTLKASENLLENERLRVEFNGMGEITSIFDKETGFELAAGLCNNFKMYKDVTTCYDAWDIDSMYEKLPVELNEKAFIEVICTGPLFAKIRIKRKVNHSLLIQEASLRRGSRRVEFHTVVNWQESHKLLKVAFPVGIRTDEAVHEIQFGHISRPNHKSRQYDADRYEVCNHKWTAVMESNRGFAVLNDCKYGVNVLGGSVNLTLLKSALAPDMYADRGWQEFIYAFYVWNGPFTKSNVVREAYELNVPVFTINGSAGERSLFGVDNPGVIIEAVKPAEDRSEDIVVRLYESKRSTIRCNLYTGLPIVKAVLANMLEVNGQELPVKDGKVELEFTPFEIKTLRLKFRPDTFSSPI